MRTVSLFVDPQEYSNMEAYIEYHYTDSFRGELIHIDVGNIVRENQDNWLRLIKDWHHELCEEGTARSKFWWLNNASRLTVWVPFDLRPLLYALAIKKISESEKFSRICLFGVPKDVLGCLLEWETCGVTNYKLIWPTTSTSHDVSSSAALFILISQFLKLFYIWIFGPKPNRKFREADLIVYSLPLSPETIRSKGDHFFGRVFDNSKQASAKVEWIYESRKVSEITEVANEINKTGRNFSFIFSYLKITDLPKIFICACVELIDLVRAARRISMPVIDGLNCSFLLKSFTRQVVKIPPVWEIALYYSFKRYLKIIRAKAIIYPYEEKGGERALIEACREMAPDACIVGFAHAAYCEGHLYMQNYLDLKRPFPDYIAVTGAATQEWLTQWGRHPLERLKIIGSPKHVSSPALLSDAKDTSNTKNILFLCGIGHEIARLISFNKENPNLFADSVLKIRKYPYSWQDQQNQDIIKLKEIGVNVLVGNQDLESEIQWADVIIFTSTSASLEAMLLNKPCIRVIDKILDTNLLTYRDKGGAVPGCNSAEELKFYLDKICSTTNTDSSMVIQNQRRLAEKIFSKWNDSLWDIINS